MVLKQEEINSIINIKSLEALLSIITIEQAETFINSSGKYNTQNIVNLLLNILHNFDLDIKDAKHILDLTKEQMEYIKV